MKKTLYVQGMHCISCEILLEQELQEIKGVTVKDISHTSGKVTLEIKNNSVLKAIEAIITEHGYTIGDKATKQNKTNTVCDIPEQKPKKGTERWIQLILIGVMRGVIFFVLKQLDVFQYFTGLSESANIGVAVLMGLVASLSTCLAVTGSVVLGFSKYVDDSEGKKGHIKTQISFQIGRIVGFFVLGGLLGLIGQTIQMSLGMTAFITILVGLVLLYMGLHMIDLVPSITKLGFHLPKSRTKSTLTTKNPAFAPLIGALTFFLPCGFTQSMQLLAIGTGGFWQGGMIMAAFALGTAPVLFAVGMGGEYIKEHKYSIVSKAIGVLIIFFGLYSVSNGRGLRGFGGNIETETTDSAIVAENINYKTITAGHNGRNMEPREIELKAGGDYEIVITPDANGQGCMSTMVIPKINREVHRILKGQDITYKITNAKAGKYDVVCASMGMYQGSFIVK